jgi:hypothetical protein
MDQKEAFGGLNSGDVLRWRFSTSFVVSFSV